MNELRARVHNGRLVLDVPTDLPEGTILDLVVDDEGDDLTVEEMQVRDAAILQAWQSAKLGKGRSAEDLLDDLRRQQ
jgi:hypothetical protein